MALTKTLNLSESDGNTNLIASVVVTSGIDNDLSVTVTSGAVNQTATIAFVLTQLGMFYALAQTATVTVFANATSGGAPACTITLLPGVPVMWYAGCGYTQTALFPANVTTLYMQGQSTTAQVDMRILKAG